MGGLTILRVAAAIPERLRRLVFIASPIPQHGDTLEALMAEIAGPLDEEGFKRGMERERARYLFAQDLDDDRANWLLDRLIPESRLAFGGAVDLSAVQGHLPRTYIRTLRDRACPSSLQDKAIAAISPVDVVEMDEGHSVMIAAPTYLAKLLNNLAR